MTSPTESEPAPGTPLPRRKRSWKRIFLMQGIVLVVGLVLAEVGTRIWLRVRGHPFDSHEAGAQIEQLMSRAVDMVPRAPDSGPPLKRELAVQVPVLQPFTGYLVTGKVEQIDYDLRTSNASLDGPQYDILVVGGSVAAVFGALGEKHFVERLKADPLFGDRPIQMYEYGVGGFKQPQSLNLVQYFLALGFRPECVLNIDGFNEVALGNANAVSGSNPLLPSLGHWESLTNSTAPDRETIGAAWAGIEDQSTILWVGEHALAWGARHSALASELVTITMKRYERRAHDAFEDYKARLHGRAGSLVVRGPEFQPGARAAAETSVRCWEECSRTLRALCEARGILYVHVLQPTLHDVGSKVPTPKELSEGQGAESWIEGVHAGYPLLRAAGERLRAGGENYIDATQIFAKVEKRIYFDVCHFGEAGNIMLGDRIADELLSCLRRGR